MWIQHKYSSSIRILKCQNPNHTFLQSRCTASKPIENLSYSHSRSDGEVYGSRHHNYNSKSSSQHRRRSRSGSESPQVRHYSGRTSRDRQRMRQARVSSAKFTANVLYKAVITMSWRRIIHRLADVLEFSAWIPTPPNRRCANCLTNLDPSNVFKWS